MDEKVNLRRRINDRMDELGWNRLELVRRCDGAVWKSQIYLFLSGKGGMRVEDVELILGLLGMDATAVRTPPKLIIILTVPRSGL
jgi:hypothetical protein